jgi:hypothetical protein
VSGAHRPKTLVPVLCALLAIALPLGVCVVVLSYHISLCTVIDGGGWPPSIVAAFDIQTLREFHNAVERGDDFVTLIESGKVFQVDPGTPGRVIASDSSSSVDFGARQIKLGGDWHGKKVWMFSDNVQMLHTPVLP